MNIKLLLKEKKMTQAQLAKALGTVRRWIKGDRLLSNTTLIALEYVLSKQHVQ